MRRDDVCVIGAGPYGLTTAAHLRGAGLNVHVFGEVMSFWKAMPCGMLLRSTRAGISLSDPTHSCSLDEYERERNTALTTPVDRGDYVKYAEWFQRGAVPEIDNRRVVRLERIEGGFRLLTSDGEALEMPRVVVAIGIESFQRRLPVLASLPRERTPHSFNLRSPAAYRGERVIVVGSGQSALESAVLLAQAGAEIEIVTRSPKIRWLVNPDHIDRERSLLSHLLYPPGALGPPGVNWIVQAPRLYRALPSFVQRRIFEQAVPPAVSGRLRPEAAHIAQVFGRAITSASMDHGQIALRLDDGSERRVDHVVQGTGFQVAIDRFGFLAPELARAIRPIAGQPKLGPGFESSVPGLHFLGWASDLSFGPLMRAIAGTAYAAHAVAEHAAGSLARSAPKSRTKTMELLEQSLSRVPALAGSSATAAAVVGMMGPALGVDPLPVHDVITPPNLPSGD